jgi:uncharacterized membrane protein YkoI
VKKLGVIAVVALAGVAFAAGCKKDNEANEAAETSAQAPAAPGAPAAFTVEAPDSLRALARISLDSASKLALARVPNGTIDKVELERENDALIWSFDIKVPGNTGIEEVAVNALTGAVGPTEHESPASEATEAREDSAARRPAAPPRRP